MTDNHRATVPGVAHWRKSTFSGASGCVAMAELDDDRIGVRDSKDPEGGVLEFTRAEIAAWVAGAKAGEFDDLC